MTHCCIYHQKQTQYDHWDVVWHQLFGMPYPYRKPFDVAETRQKLERVLPPLSDKEALLLKHVLKGLADDSDAAGGESFLHSLLTSTS
jgi:hypothetical protein